VICVRSHAVRARACVAAAILCALAPRATHADEGPPAQGATPPRPIDTPDVPYPENGKGDAVVILKVTVDANGNVTRATAASGAEPFASAAERAAMGWRFVAARRGDRAIASIVSLEIVFHAPVPAPDAPAASAAPAAPKEPADEVRVRGERPSPMTSTLARTEVRELPGAFGDPFRGIDVLPGVTPILSGLPYYYIRGAPPSAIGYYIDGIRVPYLYHFALGPSVIHPGLVDRVDLYPGGYPARFGRFVGGIVSAETMTPAAALRGEANVRFFDAGALVESPLANGRAGVLASGRYSYTAALLSAVQPDAKVDYRDYQLRAYYDLSEKERLTFFSFGAYDFAGSVKDGKLSVLFGSEFYRADVRYDRALASGGHLRLATTFGIDRSRIAEDRFVADRIVGERLEWTQPASPQVMLRAGADVLLDSYAATPINRYSDDDVTIAQDRKIYDTRLDVSTGLHADAVMRLGPKLELTPGARADLFTSGAARALAFDARVAARLALSDKVALLQAHGLAHQPPAFPIPLPGITPSRLRGGLETAVQSSAGIEATLPFASVLTATLFRNGFFRMNDPLGARAFGDDSNSSAIDARTDGQAYGLELSWRRKLTRRFGFLVSYTLSRSTRRVLGELVPSAFDRTHVLNAVATLDLGKGWRAGARMVMYSGIPRTTTQPDDTGRTHDTFVGGRYPLYYRLDARLEKRWTLGKTSWLALVFEGQNVTYTKETIGEDCGSGKCVPQEFGFPIPSIGLEGGF
jgi:hypothetical protein